MDIGDVIEMVFYPNGMRIPTVNPAKLDLYIAACVVEPAGGHLLLDQGGYRLAIQVRDAVLGFSSPIRKGRRTRLPGPRQETLPLRTRAVQRRRR